MSTSDDNAVLAKISELTELALGTYAFNPDRIEEDANGERRIHQGGYGDRQLFELVQNAADELRTDEHRGGKIHAVLTERYLHCANEGSPMTPEGADTILRMGVSKKRGGQIGRFGVGVKSVLSVTRTPQFFSKTGSFGFDADWSATEILAAVNRSRSEKGLAPVNSVGETPVLRLARALDVAQERALDPILDSMLEWASTVVRLPLISGADMRLANDIQQSGGARQDSANREFPHLFQLFSPHVGRVVLEDRRQMPIVRREIQVGHDGAFRTIDQSRTGAKATSESYRVFTIPHQVSEKAREGAGELHDRVTIDVSWAVPNYTSSTGSAYRTVPPERGTFWSYFPTKYPTTLSGALNAAWKTNEDRQNLLDSSELNSELLKVSAKLIVDSLKDLSVSDDPAAYLPLLPGRAKESPNWACKYLTEQVWNLAANVPSLPDQDGKLRKPSELRIHRDGLSDEALSLWREYSGRPHNWVHHSVEGPGSRRGKMNHILDATSSHAGSESIRDWLEALVEDRTAEASAAAIRVLAHLLENDLDGSSFATEATEARKARIVLTEGNEFVAPIAGKLFRQSVEDGLRDDLIYVDPRISEDASMLRLLDQLGIREADTAGRFHSVLDQGFRGYTPELWTRFWELLRKAGGATQTQAIRNKIEKISESLQVKTVAGRFVPLKACMWPGPVVPADGSRDGDLAVDISFHADDRSILREFGVMDRPSTGCKPNEDGWFEEYKQAMYDEYCANLGATERRVQIRTMVLEGAPTAGPLHLFKRLSDEGRAAFLTEIPDEGLIENWTRQIGRQGNTRIQVVSPIRWLVQTYGSVQTTKGLCALGDAVGPQLQAHADVLPVANISPVKAQRLRLPTRVEDVPAERWSDLLTKVKESTEDKYVGRTYALLIRVAYNLLLEEETVRCRVGDRWELLPDSEIAVALNADEYAELRRENHPALLLDSKDDAEQAEIMIREWGMRTVSDVIEKRVRSVLSGPSMALADEYPALRQRIGTRINGRFLQRCSDLEQVTRTPQGTRLTQLQSALEENTVLVLDSSDAETALILADREFGFGLGIDGCRAVLETQRKQQEDQALKSRFNEIRNCENVVEKLALLIDEADLRSGLPDGLIASESTESGQAPDIRRLAEMAYNTYDDGILHAYAKEIGTQFPGAPTRFDGGYAALKFVSDLRLPDAFAGARIPSPPEREEAEGPTDFPSLHIYQEEIAGRFVEFLQSPTPQRAMLSLPTGAGKTRVAAEGVIRWIRDSEAPIGPILWIAQTGELCEQAVQSWKFVWEKVGPEQTLVIDRLWSTNSATPVTGRAHLVVATDAKLRSCLDTADYEWLRDASLVIVDEAHVASSRQYTEILEHLGLTRYKTSRPLVGLTATPFRNDPERTRLLAQRFGDQRLDKGILGENPISRLQELGVLAQVEHRQLKGADMALHTHELAEMEKFRADPDEFNGFLPKSFEQRLADDEGRNKVLIEEITNLPPDWPVLVFATSVEHAKFLAAKLSDKGIRSVAIDSATPTSQRRKHIAEFRNKKIRVITNYGVLSQGFDAPATRAVVIARPVYSANVYQQMIGRGLRGVRNGGKESCLILDMRDNITNFNNNLAFTEFEHLWQEVR